MRNNQKSTSTRPSHLHWLGSLLLVGMIQFALTPATMADSSSNVQEEVQIESPAIAVSAALDMRDDEYNSDYIFGMTKGVADSTIIPAVKPLFFLVTIPLDIVFLPFAAIGGFF